MRFIPTKAHAMLDYAGGTLLMVLPLFWLEAAEAIPAAVWTPFFIGLAIILQSLFTNYEYSLTNSIPMSAHLGMDLLIGLLFAVSPWLFEFDEVVWLPHLLVGLFIIGSALMTKLHRPAPPLRSEARTDARPVI